MSRRKALETILQNIVVGLRADVDGDECQAFEIDLDAIPDLASVALSVMQSLGRFVQHTDQLDLVAAFQ